MPSKKKIMVVFGTRPEAIKLAPVVKMLEEMVDKFNSIVCTTAQHRQMLDQVLKLFRIIPHYDLNVMTSDQKLPELTARILLGVSEILEKEQPDMVLIQGDTTTTLVTALAAYYQKIPVAHVEAGLRTSNKYSPFPEEGNRRLTSMVADLHFTPTIESKNNLLREGIPADFIHITGNTVIDALQWVVNKLENKEVGNHWSEYFSDHHNIIFKADVKVLLVTGHRRESFGKGFEQICRALEKIARDNEDVAIVYPVHLNPNVSKPVKAILSDVENIHLISPLEYEPFVYLMNKSHLILTDSGGIQEEAPSLGKPVLVMRDTTERTEGIAAGVAKLVGTNSEKIVKETNRLLYDAALYEKMSKALNPYGNGHASRAITEIILNTLN